MNGFMDEPTCRPRRSAGDDEPIAASGRTLSCLVNPVAEATPDSNNPLPPSAAGHSHIGSRKPSFPSQGDPMPAAALCSIDPTNDHPFVVTRPVRRKEDDE